MNRPCALQDSPNPPHLCACLLWLPAVRGHSDRSRGLMGLAFRAAAFQHIKPQLSFQQKARFTKDQRLDALLRMNRGLWVFTHGAPLMSLWHS